MRVSLVFTTIVSGISTKDVFTEMFTLSDIPIISIFICLADFEAVPKNISPVSILVPLGGEMFKLFFVTGEDNQKGKRCKCF